MRSVRCQVLPAAALSDGLHTSVARALRVLKEGNFFKKDIVWVNGKLFVTRVSRTLLGEPGMTYVFSGCRVPRAVIQGLAALQAGTSGALGLPDGRLNLRAGIDTKGCASLPSRGPRVATLWSTARRQGLKSMKTTSTWRQTAREGRAEKMLRGRLRRARMDSRRMQRWLRLLASSGLSTPASPCTQPACQHPHCRQARTQQAARLVRHCPMQAGAGATPRRPCTTLSTWRSSIFLTPR